jgi:hypothetical protein
MSKNKNVFNVDSQKIRNYALCAMNVLAYRKRPGEKTGV